MKHLILLIILIFVGCKGNKYEVIEINNIGRSVIVVQTGGESFTLNSVSSINLVTEKYKFIIVKCIGECKYNVGNKNYYRTNRF